MDLKTFIEKHGDDECAKLFGSPVRTVASWRRKERTPRPKKAYEIVRLTGGEVSIDGIYGKESVAA